MDRGISLRVEGETEVFPPGGSDIPSLRSYHQKRKLVTLDVCVSRHMGLILRVVLVCRMRISLRFSTVTKPRQRMPVTE